MERQTSARAGVGEARPSGIESCVLKRTCRHRTRQTLSISPLSSGKKYFDLHRLCSSELYLSGHWFALESTRTCGRRSCSANGTASSYFHVSREMLSGLQSNFLS